MKALSCILSEWLFYLEMGYLPETNATRESYKRYSPNCEFSPYHMSGESCHKLMVELKGMLKSV